MVQLAFPTVSWALTTGPTQPEVQGFQPAGTSDMVDLFTGDFSYNIPLFELPGPNGGYPFNLSYQGGITMDQEASWVGLGWSLQPGAITRQMRGLPDEFKDDQVFTKMSIKPNISVGVGVGVGVEIFGKDKGPSLNIGLSVYHNNYKGFGYTIDGTLGVESRAKSGMTGGLSLGLSLDSNEGATVNPSLSLGGKIGEFGLSAPYNSKSGLTSVSLSHSVKALDKNFKTKSIMGSSATFSLANPGYTPQVSMPMKNLNLSATVKIGGAWWGVFGNGYISGNYSEQKLNNDKKWFSTGAYGYLNYQHAGEDDMQDFNREKDGMVSKESPNLGIPQLTYDIYSVTGQGIGMMYRPFRNDHGIIHDQHAKSTSNAISGGLDLGPAVHVGANLNVQHSESISGRWEGSSNGLASQNAFQEKEVNDPYEPWFFKVHGEPVAEKLSELNAIGGEKAVRVKLNGAAKDAVAANTLQYKPQSQMIEVPAPQNASHNRERNERNHVVSAVTNAELLSASGEEMIPYFKVTYIPEGGTSIADTVRLNRDHTDYPDNHIAGYTALNAEGLRYVYGLPAYNNLQEDVTFSVPKQSGTAIDRVPVVNTTGDDPKYTHSSKTDEFLRRTQLPRYAHSHLLTAIIGPDYVDVTGDGVTPDDLGYWVKFTYQKKISNYKWRDPYSQAHYTEGWKTDSKDDRGSFTYGEKELWYLAQAETKSHIAVFTTSARNDGKGVNAKLQDSNTTGASVYKLDMITLYTRSAGPGVPIKKTIFEYDYSLCSGVYNNASGGKLTLLRVKFQYGNSTRGLLNPYEFKYSYNQTYNMHAYDRWGNFKPVVGGARKNHEFPYVDQDPANKAQLDSSASAWHLNRIHLPSGGKIRVDYESDDYGYVQNKQAMQMVSFVDPYSAINSLNTGTVTLSKTNYRVRFKLQQPIAMSLANDEPAEQKALVSKYLDTKTWQLYFKFLVDLKPSGAPGDNKEYISGYVDVEKEGMLLEQGSTSGYYAYASFLVKKESGRNPFIQKALQHIRTNQPDMAYKNPVPELSPKSSLGDRLALIKSLGQRLVDIRRMFEGFYNSLEKDGFGQRVVVESSYIRLNSVDKIKYGGGSRVKQITLTDQWAHDQEGVYGQVYDYTIKEGDETISSGVAAFEPAVGGDENALRYAKKYTQSIALRSDNNLFFEYPVNESYYPGPQVGYRKVTVTSLASAARAGKTLVPGTNIFPAGVAYGTTGMTVHEFYTAKDFPVITDETAKENKLYRMPVPIPFFGNTSVVKLTTSQGYSITINDMHGKQKMVSNYRQDKDGNFESEPMSWVRYNYMSEQRVIGGEKVSVLSNILTADGEILRRPEVSDAVGDKITLGQETEFFYDMREYQDNTWGGGARVNTDLLFFFFFTAPIPTIWPSINSSKLTLRSVTTNKVISKNGIMASVEAYDGGSLIKTENLKWDRQTGQVVLSTVNNNFDNPIYSYTRPAFREYQGMGAAFKNIDLTLTLTGISQDTYDEKLYYFSHDPGLQEYLQKGDEILIYSSTGALEHPVTKAVYLGERDGEDLLYSEYELASSQRGKIVRSGFRNQLSVSAGSITALADPTDTVGLQRMTFSKTISVPKLDD